MTQFVPLPRIRRFTGAEKSAILFLCLGEARGGMLMQRLEENEIRKITRAISTMGEVQSELVEEIMDEFGVKLSDYGGIFGSIRTARSLLGSFLPEDRVEQILAEIEEKNATGDLWGDVSKLDEKVLAQFLRKERDQTVAAILSRLDPEATAKILPLLGRERSVQIVERILTMEELPRESVRTLEESLRREILAKVGQDADAATEKRLVSVFNKIDRDLFQEIAQVLEKNAPDRLKSIKQKMFVFDDFIRFDAPQLAKIIREVSGTTLPYALRGAQKDIREHFLGSLPSRSRDMLQEEMNAMGPLKAKDVKQAQSELVDVALRLAKEGEITLQDAGEEEEMI